MSHLRRSRDACPHPLVERAKDRVEVDNNGCRALHHDRLLSSEVEVEGKDSKVATRLHSELLPTSGGVVRLFQAWSSAHDDLQDQAGIPAHIMRIAYLPGIEPGTRGFGDRRSAIELEAYAPVCVSGTRARMQVVANRHGFAVCRCYSAPRHRSPGVLVAEPDESTRKAALVMRSGLGGWEHSS